MDHCGASAPPDQLLRYQRWSLLFAAALPVAWLTFSLSYSRGNSREFLRRWRLTLIVAAVLSPGTDVVSQALIAGPMIILYALSIVIAWVFGRRPTE